MVNDTQKKFRDLAERAGWAALWSALSVLSVEQFDLPVVVVPFVILALSTAKSFVGGKVGKTDSVSFAPQV
jgi:hypothetical protein